MTQATKLAQVLHLIQGTVEDIEKALDDGDFDMAGDHALTLEELAHEFQEKAA